MVLYHRRLSALLLLCACADGVDSAERCAEEDAFFEVEGFAQVGDSLQMRPSGSSECGASLWDFGDGQTSTEFAPSHEWREPGHFAVVHRRELASGAVSSSVLVTVTRPAVGSTSSSSTLLADGDAWIAVVPEVGVSRTGPDGLESWRGCREPRTAARGAGVLAVACAGDDALVFLDDLQEVRRATFAPGARPVGVAFDGTDFVVSLQGAGALARVRPDSAEVLSTEAMEDPRAVAAGPSGRVFATRFRSRDGLGRVYESGAAPLALAYADEVDSDNTSRGVPTLLEHLVVSPDGQTLFIPGQVSNTARGLSLDGQPLVHDAMVRAVLRGVDLLTGEERVPLDRQYDNHGRAGPMALTPLGDWLWLGFPDTGTAFQVDVWTGRPNTSVQGLGRGLTGMVVRPSDGALAVHAWLDRVVRVVDPRTGRVLEEWPTVEEEPLVAEVLWGKQIFYDALDRRITRDGYISCASCHPDGADDGLTWDFSDRGEGLRNTTSLQGRGGMDMGPLHWTGNFDEVQDFEHDLRGHFAGQGFLSTADWEATNEPLGEPKAGLSPELDALAAYLGSLTVTPPSPHEPDLSGQDLFSSLGCDGCHSGPLYTDSSNAALLRHDIGTWLPTSGGRLGADYDGFDTPTLLGTWDTGPWLHDGRAETLEQAIEAHADVLPRTLTTAELESLAAWVRSL